MSPSQLVSIHHDVNAVAGIYTIV